MSTVDLTKTFKFYHKDDPNCIYTRTPDGVISWEEYAGSDTGVRGDAGEDPSYIDHLVLSYIKSGTWIVLTEEGKE